MKSLFCCLLLLITTICFAAPAPSALVWVGTPQAPQKSTLHVNGVPMTVWNVTINLHQMGCSITSSGCYAGPASAGFWIQDGAQAKNCSLWGKAILLLEAPRPTPYHLGLLKPTPYPYLELLVTGSNQILTDEEVWVYPASSVSCNGALDWN